MVQIWTGHKKILLCSPVLSILSSVSESREPQQCPLPILSYRIHTLCRNPTNKAKQKYNQTSKTKWNKIMIIKKAKSKTPTHQRNKKKWKTELYLITSERFVFLCLEGDCSALNAFIGKCLWAVLLKCRDQIWPVISSNKATTLLFKLSVLLHPTSLSAQNKGMKSC